MSDPTAQCRVTVLLPQGLHLRPAHLIAQCVQKFSSKVELARADQHERFDAASVLSVLMLAATQGTELLVFATGPDADDAVAAVANLFAEGFGELGTSGEERT